MEKKELDFKKTIDDLKKQYGSQEINGKIITDFIDKIIANKKIG